MWPLTVKNRDVFWTFFGGHKFMWAGLVKLYPRYHPYLAGHRLKKSPVKILPLARKLSGRPEPPFRTGLYSAADVFFCFATDAPSSLDRSP